MKKLSIGVTIDYSEGYLLKNGNNQNADLLYDLLKKTKKYKVFKVIKLSEIRKNPTLKHKGFISSTEAIEKKLDIILCPGLSLQGDLYNKAIKNGIKLVDITYGNAYATLVQDLFSVYPEARYLHVNNTDKKVKWTSPHYDNQLELMACNLGVELSSIKVIPYLWKPKYLKMFFNNSIEHVRYENHAHKKSIAIYEPNLNYTKNLICPAYTILDYQKRIGFSKDEKIYFYGLSQELHNMDILYKFLNSFPSGLPRQFVVDNRRPIKQILEDSGTIISHQVHNSLNYTTLEALYLGLPIVHNSDHIKAGYHYDGFNVLEASRQLEAALNHQDSDLVAYREAADEEIWKYSPDNEKNISTYIKLIEELMDT